MIAHGTAHAKQQILPLIETFFGGHGHSPSVSGLGGTGGFSLDGGFIVSDTFIPVELNANLRTAFDFFCVLDKLVSVFDFLTRFLTLPPQKLAT